MGVPFRTKEMGGGGGGAVHALYLNELTSKPKQTKNTTKKLISKYATGKHSSSNKSLSGTPMCSIFIECPKFYKLLVIFKFLNLPKCSRSDRILVDFERLNGDLSQLALAVFRIRCCGAHRKRSSRYLYHILILVVDRI